MRIPKPAKLRPDERKKLRQALERLAGGAVKAEGAAPPAAEHLVLAGYRVQDAALVAAGMPPTSPWWMEQIERFYRSGRRQLVARVGRGGGKSTTSCRVAVAEARFGDHPLRPGDLGVIPIISVGRDEAADRLKTLRAILDAVAEPYAPRGQALVLERRPIEFRVYPATIGGVSGFTTLFALCDEVAKWRNADRNANPAFEVLASLRPTMRGRPHSHIWLVSSPFGVLDAHAHAFDEGETAYQLTAFAPTWVANPTISEEQSHAEEPDEQVWRREWAAIPLEGSLESLIAPALLDAAEARFEPHAEPRPGWSYIAATDPGTRNNAWTLIIGTAAPDGRRHIVAWAEWRRVAHRAEGVAETMQAIAEICARYGVRHLHSDQWGFDFLSEIARRPHRVQRNREEVDWPIAMVLDQITPGSKLALYEGFARAMADGQVALPKERTIRSDLLGIRRKITAAGKSTDLAKTPDGRHSDYAQPIAMVASALYIPAPRVVATSTSEQIEEHVERVEQRRYGREQPDFLGLPKLRSVKKLPKLG